VGVLRFGEVQYDLGHNGFVKHTSFGGGWGVVGCGVGVWCGVGFVWLGVGGVVLVKRGVILQGGKIGCAVWKACVDVGWVVKKGVRLGGGGGPAERGEERCADHR